MTECMKTSGGADSGGDINRIKMYEICKKIFIEKTKIKHRHLEQASHVTINSNFTDIYRNGGGSQW